MLVRRVVVHIEIRQTNNYEKTLVLHTTSTVEYDITVYRRYTTTELEQKKFHRMSFRIIFNTQ